VEYILNHIVNLKEDSKKVVVLKWQDNEDSGSSAYPAN
jgi:hypothetical protein